MIKIRLLLIMVTLIHFCQSDYYWKNYYGKVPEDAFAGGSDEEGNPTYIGLTFFPARNFILPTIIKKGHRFAFTATENKHFQSDKNTKILCVSNGTRLKWESTTTSKLNKIACPQIGGANWDGVPMTIGRANILGRLLTGMVTNDPKNKWYGLWVFDANYKTINTQTFQVLTLDCSKWGNENEHLPIVH